VVTNFKPADSFANSFNNSGAFMAANDGQCEWQVASCEVFV
jgi:hypothetical protein